MNIMQGQAKLDHLIRQALIEDIGKGDITTALTIPKEKQVEAVLITKEACVICGLKAAERTFKLVDKATQFTASVKEGQWLKCGKTIVKISGKARSILSAERTALNLFSMLSGIATKTRQYVREIQPYQAKISDTRKTFPGLRELQKYAVRVGGGHNHRMRLDEMLLIKDNHLKVTDGFTKLPSVPKGFKIEIEVQNLQDFVHALKFKPDIIMLDNMRVSDIQKAVKLRDQAVFNRHQPPTKLEASGAITLKNVKEIAACAVEIISIGELTDSVTSIDISLEII